MVYLLYVVLSFMLEAMFWSWRCPLVLHLVYDHVVCKSTSD